MVFQKKIGVSSLNKEKMNRHQFLPQSSIADRLTSLQGRSLRGAGRRYRANSGRVEQYDTRGDGGGLQLAVVARQRQAPADGQLQIGGVIGGKLIVSGQLNDVGKGPVAGLPI